MRYVKGAYASIDDGYSAIRDMLKLLDDPYTRFLTPNQFSSLTSVATGRLGGVGIELFPTADPLTVSGPMEGGPADRAGVRARDVITNIDGETVKGLGIDEAVARIGGKAGTGVSLTVVHEGGKEQSFYIVREDVHVKSVKIEKLKQGEVVIRIKQFNTSTADDVREGMKKVGGGVKRIIVDVRNNAGGYFAGGVDVARLFMRDGSAIVHIVDRNGIEEEIDAVGDGGYVEVPMVVVVNKATASASEILTGALKDCGRAVVVGERTFGKGVVQTLLSMSDGSGVAITTARYETGGHHNINKVGISPDVESSCDSQADVHVCLPDGIWNKST